MLEKLPEAIGHALINQRAGMENVVYNQLYRARRVARFEVSSRAFVFNARLPSRYTADGDGISPPLAWGVLPEGTDAIVLLVEDADSPTPHPLVHAIVTGLEHAAGALEEGALDSPDHRGSGLPTGDSALATGGNEAARVAAGQNSFLKNAWLPPDPPPGHGEHRYVFQLFALGPGMAFPDSLGRRAAIDLILDRAIGVACLIGTYERSVREAEDVLGVSLQPSA